MVSVETQLKRVVDDPLPAFVQIRDASSIEVDPMSGRSQFCRVSSPSRPEILTAGRGTDAAPEAIRPFMSSGKAGMTEKKNTGPEEAVRGVVEGVKGKAKEVIGTVTGRDDVVREGQAQQDKADAQRDATKKEAEADAARAGAEGAERRQQAEQRR